MADYIKREDAKELFEMLLEQYHDTGVEVIKHTAAIAPKEFHISEEDDIADFNFEIDGWKKDLSEIPSADVAPVRHGRWEDEFKEDAEAFVKHRYVCTACSNWQTYSKTAYCPNCGASMDR